MDEFIEKPIIIDEYTRLSNQIEKYLDREDIEDTDEVISAYTLERLFQEENQRFLEIQKECNKLLKKMNNTYTTKQNIGRIVRREKPLFKEIKQIKLLVEEDHIELIIKLKDPHKNKFQGKRATYTIYIEKDKETLYVMNGNNHPEIILGHYNELLTILNEAEILLEKYQITSIEPPIYLTIRHGIIYKDDIFTLISKPGFLLPTTCLTELKLTDDKYDIINNIQKDGYGSSLLRAIHHNKQNLLRKIPLKVKELPNVYQNLIKYYRINEQEKPKKRTRKLY